jgi:hypothetical protein
VLPEWFRQALAGTEELLVTSREEGREGSVRTWYAVTAGGDLYLFNYAYATRVRRWREDPWVRLTIPGTSASVEGTVHFIGPNTELSPEVVDLVVERWGMWGATTPEGLRRMLRDGSHILARVVVTHD